jgi:hypothetical protein
MSENDINAIPYLRHPEWYNLLSDWSKWRYTYAGGRAFIDKYLIKFSEREDSSDFAIRKKITYCPAFAKAAINEVKDAIFQRMSDITRRGGSANYQAAMFGNVDRRGNNMNTFIAQCIIPELLTMSKVGIYVDMPKLNGPLLSQNKNKRPFLYYYTAEQILSWTYDSDNTLTAVLLKDCYEKFDQYSGMPTGNEEGYRHIYLDNGQVKVQIYDVDGALTGEEITINVPEIPFVILNINDSLLTDVADYQIALLNLASSDLGYILKSNFPFYTEQVDSRIISNHIKPEGSEGTSDVKEIKTGAVHGRTYNKDLERPGFIHPSSEPLTASMSKQDQLKAEIRMLIHLAITNINPGRMASAESKGFDERSLEAGLSYIGLILEFGENRVSRFWQNYEDAGSEGAIVKYPQRYSLKSEEERSKEAESYAKQMDRVGSLEFKKQMAKRIVDLVLGPKVPLEVISKINLEIENATALVGDPDVVLNDVINGILGNETACAIRCYPEGEADRAAKDHAEKLKRIADNQATNEPVRGVTSTPDTVRQDRQSEPGGPPKLRGDGK